MDSEYGEYLTWERSDAFVVALLYYAMIKQRDIEWETPCSEQLIYQLSTYFIPVYARELAFMNEIELIGPTTTELLPSENGVATGMSNGVDSSYTVLKYLNNTLPEYHLTHLLLTDCFTTGFPKGYQEDFRESYLRVLPEGAKELGLKFLFVEFHPDVQFSVGYFKDKTCGVINDWGLHPLKYCSMALALQKLITTFYFSGGVSPSDFSFHENDMAYHDLFTLPQITTQALRFYSTGMETPRIDKVAAIADWPYAQKYLQVCLDENEGNCGHCDKCLRTMSELYALGKLDLFRSRFPVDDYKAHLAQRFASVLAKAHKGHIFEKNILLKMRENNITVPAMAYLLCPLVMLREFLRSHLRTVGWARKIHRVLSERHLVNRHRRWDFSQGMDEAFSSKRK